MFEQTRSIFSHLGPFDVEPLTSIRPHTIKRDWPYRRVGLIPLSDKPITYLAAADDSACGAAIDWGARTGFYPSPAEAEPLARKVRDTAGVHFIPALWGLRKVSFFSPVFLDLIRFSEKFTAGCVGISKSGPKVSNFATQHAHAIFSLFVFIQKFGK